MAQRQITPERKAVYYAGMIVGGIGLLLFLSTFFSAAKNFGNFNDFEGRSKSQFARAITGMVMMIGGSFLMRVGRSGVAGSGLKLDPEDARRDVEPWSRMSGGVLKDTLEEADIRLGQISGTKDLPIDERLRRLQKARDEGLITEQEFTATRQKILESA